MPSISWPTARTELATILADAFITDPVGLVMKRVFEQPPKQLSDLPCVVIVDAVKGPVERSMQIRERSYTVRMQLLAEDADVNSASDILDAFQEAITDLIDDNVTLNGTASLVIGPEWTEQGTIDQGGQSRQGVEGTLIVNMVDTPATGSFGP